MERSPALSTLGAVGAAFASALCCVGPLLYVSLGVGAGLASTFEPLRPWFLGAAALFLAPGFHRVYGHRPRCAPDDDVGRTERRAKLLLWAGTALVVVFATFPAWSAWLT
jgi:mercuric ion transport protein